MARGRSLGSERSTGVTASRGVDASRGVEGTFMWLTEEIGELATALRSGSHEEQSLEFADVLAWLATIANVVEVDLEDAVARKYGTGCPGCGQLACVCPDAEKP